MTEEEQDLPTAILRSAKKAVTKKVAVKKAPAKKAAAKPKAKAVEVATAPPPKKAAKQKAAPVAAPAPEPVAEASAPKKKAAPKKKTAPAPEPAAVEKAPAAPEPVAEAPPVQTASEDQARPPQRDHRNPRGPQQRPQQQREPGQPPQQQQPREQGPQQPREPGQPPPQGQPQQPGPDGQPRRLTKWERWKARKEKFKEMKRQRYMEKQGGRPPEGGGRPPGENGHAPQRERERERDRERDNGPDDNFERPMRPELPLGPPEDCAGLLELTPGKGFGFLRPRERNYAPLPTDPFVTPEMVRNLGLRDGLWIEAVMRRGGRGPQVIEIKTVNGRAADSYRLLPLFEELTAINPTKRYVLETDARRYTTRLIDFISPIGRGQRGLIVAPPRAGKTTILQHIAEAVRHNYPDIKLIVLLVDERPEEVTEITRAIPGAEVMASNNDRDPREHIRIAALAMERARRLVEAGEHVFMLLDSITRLARAFNNAIRGNGGGKGSLSGGVDARALEGARRMFASARNTREAGSLTIVGTALIETNSRADDLIFQEFKGTGNMELVLDRKIAQQYIYPAVDIFKSGTRREELLLPPHQMEKVHVIRRGLAGHKPVEAVERLIHFMERFNNNAQLLVEIKSRE